ncbi:cytidylate kinase-like family protein [Roseburia sp. 1XD42-69]|uniref:cytidylate kinase-like family protein n=1 Tax=Roseburia sp. 1XD42-69 TaxID=2320088 RepID=UPI000EA1DFF9|nr:cytidylate kinase-like family protein [Roseburia sp. 1XD42-69]RKJ61876.1 cytidylate kinase-like family protein [Roseburia sp. 1XD42-69]
MYHIITIERSYGSGGNEIGKRLAEKLGYKLFDRNILIEAAQNLNTPPMYIENLEESSSGSLIFNLSKSYSKGNMDEKSLPLAEKLFAEEKRIIEKAADEGGCVIVGRGAGYILKDREDCLRVFVHAEREKRIHRAMEKEHMSQTEAENAMKKFDKRRKGFYNSVTKWEWGNPQYFELCLDSGKLGIDLCIKLLTGVVSASE